MASRGRAAVPGRARLACLWRHCCSWARLLGVLVWATRLAPIGCGRRLLVGRRWLGPLHAAAPGQVGRGAAARAARQLGGDVPCSTSPCGPCGGCPCGGPCGGAPLLPAPLLPAPPEHLVPRQRPWKAWVCENAACLEALRWPSVDAIWAPDGLPLRNRSCSIATCGLSTRPIISSLSAAGHGFNQVSVQAIPTHATSGMCHEQVLA